MWGLFRKDYPNATCMVVENADRFGLSQLHQLRGRVGRGKAKSYCILLSDSQNEETRARLKVMTQTNDGFRISQEDLRLRGPGDFFGQRQHGLPAMKIADLSCDMRLLDEAQTAARQLMERDPELTDPAHRPLRRRIRQLFDTNADMLNQMMECERVVIDCPVFSGYFVFTRPADCPPAAPGPPRPPWRRGRRRSG